MSVFGWYFEPIQPGCKDRLLVGVYYHFSRMVLFARLLGSSAGAIFLSTDQLADSERNHWIDVFCYGNPVGLEVLMIDE
jgi:hypothetical protein